MTTEILSSWLLLGITILLTAIEYQYTRSIFSPFTVNAWPLAGISVMVNLLAVKIGFLPVTTRVNYFLILNLAIIWIVGMIWGQRYKDFQLKRDHLPEIFRKYKDFRYFMILLSWIVIAVVFMKLFLVIGKEGWAFIGTQDFEDQMSRGVSAHFVCLGQVLLILQVLSLWGTRKSILDYMTLFALSISIFSLMVKNPLILTFMSLFFIKNMGVSAKKQLRKIGNLTLLVVVIFFLNFCILYIGWGSFAFDNEDMWVRIVGWLFAYMFCGPILLDQWMNRAFISPWWVYFIVPMNLVYVIIGNPQRLKAVKYVSPGFVRIAPEYLGNVGTSYGVNYLIGGLGFTLLMTILMAIVSYWAYYQSLKTARPIAVFLNACLLTIGTLSFFGQFLTLITIYEMILFFVLLVKVFDMILSVKEN